jgi:hypothetical protein
LEWNVAAPVGKRVWFRVEKFASTQIRKGDFMSENWIDYPSGIGYDPIDFPSLYGFDEFGKTTVSVKPRDIGQHICTKVEESIESVDGLFQYRNQKSSAQTLAHWVGSLTGLELVDKPTANRLGDLVIEFAKADKTEQQKIAKEKLRPLLTSLRPSKRS